MTNLRSVARPTGKVAIAGQGYVGLPKISDERCAVIEDGSGPWRSPPGRAARGLLHRRRTTPGPSVRLRAALPRSRGARGRTASSPARSGVPEGQAAFGPLFPASGRLCGLIDQPPWERRPQNPRRHTVGKTFSLGEPHLSGPWQTTENAIPVDLCYS